MCLPLLTLAMALLLCLLPPASPSTTLKPPVFDPDSVACSTEAIPYPFGIRGQSDYRPGFEVQCDPMKNTNSTLLLGNNKLQIIDISIEHGYVRAFLSSFAWQCTRGTVLSTVPSLEGTPYTFSSANKLTVIGCDAVALVQVPNGHAGGHKYISGCVSFCASLESVIDGRCSGVGCCQASIPSGLKTIQLNFTTITSLTHSRPLVNFTCSEVFLVDQSQFTFDAGDVRASSGFANRPVVLDWAIGNETCEDANKRNASDFACMERSTCYNSPTRKGYRCNCSQGYSGNPYVSGGCKDVDECSDLPQGNPCAWKCVNEEGTFHCRCPPLWQGDGHKRGSGCKKPTAFDIALSVGLCVLIVLIAGGFFTYWEIKRRVLSKRKQRHFMRNGGLLLRQHTTLGEAAPRIFSIEEIERATNNFDQSNVVGHGGYGTVYRGTLSDQTVVAIKKSKVVDESQIEQFINEVAILSKTSHPHVVKLLGCCLETQVPLLVYEFISNGNLFHYVHQKSPSDHMSWDNRLRIAVETAQALAYLHTKSSISIIHRDFKSANILLDEDYNAKISDFGASRLVPMDQTHVTTLVQGTFGYLDPEYFSTAQLTEKSDVYSFGVVLVELLTSEKPVSFCRAERNLSSHFIMLLEENRLLEVVDYRILKEAGELHVFTVAHLAKRCLSFKGEQRPTMTEVAIELNALRKLMLLHRHQQNREEEGLYLAKPLSIQGNQSNRAQYEQESLPLL